MAVRAVSNFGFNILIGVIFVSASETSNYCNVSYTCYRTCGRTTGLFFWYYEHYYACSAVCHRQACCSGYTGMNCTIPAPCNEAKVLPDLERRARNYQAKGDTADDPYVVDQYTGPDWFSVGDHKMPDSTNKPDFSFCGTLQPIYARGTHPVLNNSTDPVSFDACELYPFHDCLNTYNVEVRKCGNDLQYYLPRTSSQSAYCMDPPDIQNVTAFLPAPTDVKIGKLTVLPKLRFKLNHHSEIPYLEFVCEEVPSKNRSNVFYSTYWFVDAVLFKAFQRKDEFVSLTEDDLIEKKLGFTLQCGISVSSSLTGLQTEMATSAHFYAGIEVHPLVLNMNKEETDIITLRPTVPLGCYAFLGDEPTFKCVHTVSMHYPDLSFEQCEVGITSIGSLPMVNDHQKICGAEIKGFYPYQVRGSSSLNMENVTMRITSPYFSNSDPVHYKLGLITQDNGGHAIWKNAILPEVQLNIITSTQYQKKQCYAHVDPHMQTADGRTYEHNDEDGRYILYKHLDNGIEVQIKTTRCNHNRAYCICAVAIRAGGDVFLINLCGSLRFIDMISCKDGGSLMIQKYSELNYQVQTHIGTLVKVQILTESYANLMNVDVHMAPKDFKRIRGLCGTFDGNTGNDFHDRHGNTVSRTSFIASWGVSSTDITMLEPTCSVDVDTWEESGQLLYCTCNCYGELKETCGTPEITATCSPSQYVNCSVSHSKNHELCEDYEERCNIENRMRRSLVSSHPESEMKRRAALAELPHKFVVKRQADVSTNFTEESSYELCRNHILTDSVKQNEELLGGFNITQAIVDCSWDVFTGQDSGWADTHKQAADSAIEIGYKRDANYTMSHIDELKQFKMQTCPYNCSGNGVCRENGTCSCDDSFFGPDCGGDKSRGPVIEDLEGGGLCDQRYGSECKCFSVQADAIHEMFTCKIFKKKKLSNGNIEDVGSESTSGRYRNLYNGECCFPEGRKKRSTEEETDVLHYMFDVSLSNDGVNYGSVSTVYVYDSTCLSANKDDPEKVIFTMKVNTCLIQGLCYEENDFDLSNDCNKCQPGKVQLNWTDVCVPEKQSDSSNTELIAGLTILGIIVLVAIITACVCCFKSNNTHRTIQASQEFTMIREQSKPSFNISELFNTQTY